MRFQDHAGARRPRHLGRAQGSWGDELLRHPRQRAGMARTAGPRRRESFSVKDYGLDLAVIGNGRTAALVDPASRLVWWCFPRFDGDPIFCRLLSGDEDKGFADVVLDDVVDVQSEYLRNTA